MAKKANSRNGTALAESGKKQTFTFVSPDAKSVELVGDFTQWQQQPIRLQKSADGVWRTTVELPTGPHYYRFLVDGQWHDDPKCTLHVPNPFGSQDCVCQVR